MNGPTFRPAKPAIGRSILSADLTPTILVPPHPEFPTIPESVVEDFFVVFEVRIDVFAEPWKSKDGRKGWSPVCSIKFDEARCALSPANNLTGGCARCSSPEYVPLSTKTIANHLSGCRSQIGGYPLIPRATSRNGQVVENVCRFVAADFDNHTGDPAKNPFAEALAVQAIAATQGITAHSEVSKSTKGAHLWILFTDYVPAGHARRLMFSLMASAKVLSAKDSLDTFDRLFPNQNNLVGKKLGNLIGLPLAGRHLKDGGTAFIDPQTGLYFADQHGFLHALAEQIRAGGGNLVVTPEQLTTALEGLRDFDPAMQRPAPAKSKQNSKSRRSRSASSGSCRSLFDRCTFLAHCRDDATTLSEEDWKNAISNLCRFEDGREVIHEISAPYASYTASETDAKIDHLAQSSGPITCEYIQRSFEGCPVNGCKVTSPAALAPRGNFDKEGEDDKPTYSEIAADFLSARWMIKRTLILRVHRGDWYRFTGRAYVPFDEEELRAEYIKFSQVDNYLDRKFSKAFAENVLAVVRAECLVPSEVEPHSWLDKNGAPAKNLVVVENGILDVEKAAQNDPTALIPHSPAFFTTVALPFPYDPQATCPRFEQFLREVLPDDEVRELVIEWLGYNLIMDTSLHAFAIFVGPGSNGKGVLTLIMRDLIGPGNVSTVPLERFGERFALAETLGKLANVVAEISEFDKAAEGILKSYTAGDPMTFEKKFRPSFTAVSTARLTLACNVLPRFSDRSEGIWRRLLLIPFDVVIPPERRDPHLVAHLRDELSGIFNLALGGLRRLRERGDFQRPATVTAAIAEYRRDVNSARAFFHEEVVADASGECPAKELYAAYTTWCRERGYHPFSEAPFGKELRVCFPSATRLQRRGIGGQRHWAYTGIQLQDPTTSQGGMLTSTALASSRMPMSTFSTLASPSPVVTGVSPVHGGVKH